MTTTRKKRFIPHLVAADVMQRIRPLTLQAEQARSVRDLARVDAIATDLARIVPEGLEAIALYYKACAARLENISPQTLLEPLADCDIPAVRARAELALGTNACWVCSYGVAEKHYARAEALFSESFDLVGVLQLRKMKAVVRGEIGDHGEALTALRGCWGLASQLSRALPALAYDVLNSIAIELGSNGEPESAAALIGTVTQSPFVRAYPEWLETEMDIRQLAHRRSVFTGASWERGEVCDISAYQEKRRAREEEIDAIRIQIIHTVSERPDLNPQSGRKILSILG